MSPRVIETVCADLDRSADRLTRHASLLDAAERARAAAFRFERDRRRFVARRALLRIFLGGRLGRPPETVRYTRNAFGKPHLADGGPAFNTSHAGGITLYAFGQGETGDDIGCDIAWCDPDLPALALAPHGLPPTDQHRLARLPPRDRARAFIEAWTAQEAYVKALGTGLGTLPSAVAAGWTIRRFDPRPGYRAAVAAAGTDWTLAPMLMDMDF